MTEVCEGRCGVDDTKTIHSVVQGSVEQGHP